MRFTTVNMPLAVGIILIAFLSWTGIGFFVKKLYVARVSYEKTQEDIYSLQVQALSAARARAMVRNTITERQELTASVPKDIVGAINRTLALSNTGGISLSVGNASEDTSVKTPLQAALVTLEGDGSFEDVLRTVALLEALPVPSSLEGFSIEYRSGAAQKAPWHFSAKSKVFAFAETGTTTATSTAP